MSESKNGWNDLISTDWDHLPWTHERDDDLGWHYRDEPYRGLLIVAETEVYFHDDETGEEIEVRVGIGVEFMDWGAAVPDGSGYLATAQAVVHPDSLSESSLQGVTPTNMDPEDVGYLDVCDYGYSAKIEEAHSETSWKDAYEEVKPGLGLADFGIGFILDRPWNRMGTTGWDLIRDAANDVDAFEASLERAKDRHGL